MLIFQLLIKYNLVYCVGKGIIAPTENVRNNVSKAPVE